MLKQCLDVLISDFFLVASFLQSLILIVWLFAFFILTGIGE